MVLEQVLRRLLLFHRHHSGRLVAHLNVGIDDSTSRYRAQPRTLQSLTLAKLRRFDCRRYCRLLRLYTSVTSSYMTRSEGASSCWLKHPCALVLMMVESVCCRHRCCSTEEKLKVVQQILLILPFWASSNKVLSNWDSTSVSCLTFLQSCGHLFQILSFD